jgi:hypothetical protein
MYRLLLLAFLAVGAACAPRTSPGQPAAVRLLSVAEARALGPGATVVVEGTVSVPPGVFDGGFALQDRTGGLWVLPPSTSTALPLPLGEGVRVRGTLDVSNGQLSLQPAAIQALGPRAAPEPRLLATGALGAYAEGWLVRVAGRVAAAPVEDAPWGWLATLDDGTGPVAVYLSSSTDVNPALFRPGAELEVTGFAGRYEDRLEVLPRGRADVRPVPRP